MNQVTGILRLCSMAVLFAALTFAQGASAVVLDFSALAGSNVDFVSTAAGADFTFEDEVAGSYNDFVVIFSTTGTAVGLTGDIDGLFSFASGGIVVVGTEETAAVASVGGTLAIDDGAGFILTATLAWVDIQTDGTVGFANTSGTLNLSGITYFGVNADLLALTVFDGVVTSSFSSTLSPTLTSISSAAVGTHTIYNNYSGAISNVPEPATLSLLGIGLLGFAVRARRNKTLI